MPLNLAIHKATITDDGGTITASQANINGIHDEDQSTNVLQIATNNTFYLHYDLGAPYQLKQLRIYASIVGTVYWVVQCSNNDADWSTETVVDGSTYIYVDINDGYRYIRIRCDTTGQAAVTMREFVIDADATLMKYQTGAGDQIGNTTDAGEEKHDTTQYEILIDFENPAPNDGYLVAFRGVKQLVNEIPDFRIYILRDVGSSWQVVQVATGFTGEILTISTVVVIDPPLKFNAGDLLGFRIEGDSTKGKYRRASVPGASYYWYEPSGDPAVGDTLLKSTFYLRADYELRANSVTFADLGIGFNTIAIPDRYLTGNPGASTNPRVVNTGVIDGITPTLAFYPVVSSLSASINDSQATFTLNDASNFPQAAAGAEHGGEVLIGTEELSYTYFIGDEAQGVVRGIHGTSAAAHSQWDIVKDNTPYIEISVDDSTFKKPGDAGLPLSLGADITAGAYKTFYVRANPPYEYQDDKQIYSRIHVLWSV